MKIWCFPPLRYYTTPIIPHNLLLTALVTKCLFMLMTAETLIVSPPLYRSNWSWKSIHAESLNTAAKTTWKWCLVAQNPKTIIQHWPPCAQCFTISFLTCIVLVLVHAYTFYELLESFFYQKAANQNFTSHKQIWYNKCSYYSPGSESEITCRHLIILWFYLQAVHLVLGLFIPGGWGEPLFQFVVFWFLCSKTWFLCLALLSFWLV